MQVHSLTAFAEFVRSEHKPLDATAHVESPHSVSLFGPLEPEFRTREVYATASCAELVQESTFPFGKYLSHEEFVVYAQARIEPTDELKRMLSVVGSIKEENVRTTSDDGVTQTVTARQGIARAADVAVPNPVTLRPYRTFQEVAQPESAFILRMRGSGDGLPSSLASASTSISTGTDRGTLSGDGLPSCALFEADGGRWELEAMQSIAEFLKRSVEGLQVLA